MLTRYYYDDHLYLYYCILTSIYAVYIILICHISVIHITHIVYVRRSFSRLQILH